jgi:hypothetical protein
VELLHVRLRVYKLRQEPFTGPGTAFDIFTGDIGTWWERGTRYWNDPARGVELRLEPGSGTRVTVEHGGWDRVPAADPGLTDGYSQGWQELLGFYAQAAEED